jgi:hypothetical protein
MNFGEALQALKEGKKVKREIWGGYWRLYKHATLNGLSAEDGHALYCEPEDIIIAKLKDGGIVPAQPYQIDILAEDWKIVE